MHRNTWWTIYENCCIDKTSSTWYRLINILSCVFFKMYSLGPPRFYPPQPVLASKGSEVMLKCQLEKDTEPIV
jgi:hypothetical protein